MNIVTAVLFLAAIPSNLSLQNAIPPTLSARPVMYRELASKTYVPLAYHVSIGVAELPFSVFASTMFSCIIYFLVGLEASRFPFFLLSVVLLSYMATMLGIAIASFSPTAAIGMTIANMLETLFSVLTGFLIRKPQLPAWWRWAIWVNPNAWYLAGTAQNALAGETFVCTPEEVGAFPLPPNFAECADIPAGANGVAYAASAMGEGLCSFCRFPNGETLLDELGVTTNKWLSILALFVWILICRVLAGIGFSRMKFGTK